MWYSLLADFIVSIHIAYVAYIIGGLILILAGWKHKWNWIRNPWFRFTHLAAIIIVVLELLFKTACPLTVWEMEFRSLAGQPVSEATFVGRLMNHLLFVAVPAWVSNAMYIGFALVIAVIFVLAPPHWSRNKQSS
jgi:Protein of Unknown function (DUF2784)